MASTPTPEEDEAGPSSKLPLRQVPSSATTPASSRNKDLDTWTRKQLDAEMSQTKATLKTKKRKLQPRASYDAEFWTTRAEVNETEAKSTELYTHLRYHDYKDGGGTEAFGTWFKSNEDVTGRLKEQKECFEHAAQVSRKQAARLSLKHPGRAFRAVFTKLFHGSRMGFDIKDAQQGPRESSDQQEMRTQMIKAYCDPATPKKIWEPVIGGSIEKARVHAAHLFPYRSVGFMDDIFGEGSSVEIFSPLNGLFLHPEIEDALKKGFLAIVPDVPLDGQASETNRDEYNAQIAEWVSREVRDYKVIVLDAKQPSMQLDTFDTGGINTLAQLHNRKLKFFNDNRPRARYVWWTFLAAIHKASWRQKNKPDNLIQEEVVKGTKYWGTAGRYVKKNLLAAFVEELGQDAGDLLSNALEEPGTQGDDEVNPLGVLLVTEERTFNAKKRVREVTGDDLDESEDESGSETEEHDPSSVGV